MGFNGSGLPFFPTTLQIGQCNSHSSSPSEVKSLSVCSDMPRGSGASGSCSCSTMLFTGRGAAAAKAFPFSSRNVCRASRWPDGRRPPFAFKNLVYSSHSRRGWSPPQWWHFLNSLILGLMGLPLASRGQMPGGSNLTPGGRRPGAAGEEGAAREGGGLVR